MSTPTPNTPNTPNPLHGVERFDVLLDAHLTGELAGAEQAEFDRLVQASPEAAARLAREVEIAGALRRAFAPPATMPRIPSGSEESKALKLSPRRRLVWIAAAAVVVLAAGVGAYVMLGQKTQAERVYATLVENGFKPPIPCTTEEFPKFVKNRFGASLLASVTPGSGVEFLGWGYNKDAGATPMGDRTAILYVLVDGKQVVVLMDKASEDRPVKVSGRSGLHLHRKEVGGMVLYEISPLAEERVLPAISPG